MKTILLVVVILFNFILTKGQSIVSVLSRVPENAIRQQVDEWIMPYNNDSTPGGVILVVHDGSIVFQKAFGIANLQHHIPFTVSTLTNIGSTSKQFTAFSIALLQEKGLLDFSDDIRKYFPELPDLGSKVTLARLISHTSGYPEIFNTLMMAGLNFSDQINRPEVISLIQRQPELQNVPGEVWNYNNNGYILLAMVVEKITGTSFDKWMKDNIFDILDMKNTLVRMDPQQVISNSAQGYGTDEEGNFRELTDLYVSTGAGGIYTTAGDLAKWIANYFNPAAGDKNLIDMMTTPYTLNSGEKTNYGFGLIIDKLNGLERFQHGGADVPHRSQFFVFPAVNGAVVLLSNNAGISQDIAVKIAELFLGDVMEPKKDDGFNYDLEYPGFIPDSFDEFAGRFAIEEAPDFVMEFTREGNKYFIQATGQPRFEIFPGSDSTFFLKVIRAGVTFHRNGEGKVKTITLHQNGLHKANRITENIWQPSPDDIAQYTGKYFSEELETFYTIDVGEDNKLLLRHRRTGDIILGESKPDVFNGKMPILVVKFMRDAQGKATGFKASNGRTIDVWFEKM